MLGDSASESNPTDTDHATGRPAALTVLPDGIPALLKERAQWVLWRYVWNPDKKRKDGSGEMGEWDKPPFNAHTGGYASSADARTWATFDEVLDAYRRGTWDGIGFLSLPEDYLGTIDLDDCISAGVVKPWAAQIVDRLSTYSERSPSGTGLRIVCKGRKPDRKRSKKTLPDGAIEIYDGLTAAGKPGGRYLTFTGHCLTNVPTTVEDRQDEFAEVYRETFAQEKRQQAPKGKKKHSTSQDEARCKVERMTDDALLQAAFSNPKNGGKIKALYHGDTSAHNGDDSAADMALCCHLAHYAHSDVARMDRLFRGSLLMRPKWDERRGQQTYGERTLARAVELTTEFYEPYVPPLRSTWPHAKAPPGGNGEATSGKAGVPGDHDSDRTNANEEGDRPHLTDRGNAIRLARERGSDLRHCHPWKKWLVWSEGRWRKDDAATVTLYAKRTIVRLYRLALEKAKAIGEALGFQEEKESAA
jgi:putative DNA primase/helicase